MRRISVTKSVQRDQGHRMLAASQQSTVMSDRIRVLKRDNMRLRAMLCIERERIDNLRHHMAYMQEELRTMPTATRTKMAPAAIEEMIKRRTMDGGENGNGNGLGGGNGNGNPNVNVGGVVPAARECTYQDFLKFQPLTFKENEGVVRLTRWFEKMETLFHISNCPPKYQVKFGVENNDLTAYTQKFQELVLLCTKMVLEEEDRDTVRIANNLMDQKLKGYAARNAENKRRFENNSRDNRVRKLRPNEAEAEPTPQEWSSLTLTPTTVLLDIVPSTLDVSYAVELADGRIAEMNILLRGCTLGLVGHPFDIDLMPVKLGSFDVIIGMDWLSRYHAVIICDEKIVRIHYGNEVLEIQGDGCSGGDESRLCIISCTKTQKYIQKGCQVFLPQIMEKKAEEKSEG
ncbi:putative reverse transcriptase domain-containing protein [Tanacetum coccineum]